MEANIKPVPGFPMYTVSDEGEVFGQQGQPLKFFQAKGGYLRFSPSVEGKLCHMFVHRAVLLAFTGDPPDQERRFACHIDGDPTNNRLENLYWGSFEDNWADRKRHGNGGFGEQNGRAKMTQEKADELRRMYATGNYSYWQLADHFGISSAQANKIGRNLFWPELDIERKVS